MPECFADNGEETSFFDLSQPVPIEVTIEMIWKIPQEWGDGMCTSVLDGLEVETAGCQSLCSIL
jgi:hypothetical protein